MKRQLSRKLKVKLFTLFMSMVTVGGFGQTVLAATAYVPQYTSDSTGTYPTKSWQPTGQTNVINNQGYNTETGAYDASTWDGNPNNLTNSYISYGANGENGKNQSGEDYDYQLRKYARETSTLGLYDVYLNVRGATVRQPTDIVFIADWSGSMNDKLPGSSSSKIELQEKVMKNILDKLPDSETLNIGFIGYSSEVDAGASGTWGSANKHGSKASVAIQSSAQAKVAIKSAYNENIDKNGGQVIQTGATFTEKALVDAKALFNQSNGHRKMVVLMTDGVPTFSYHVNQAADNGGEDPITKGIIGIEQDHDKIDGDGQHLSYGTHSYNVNGYTINNTFNALKGSAIDLKTNYGADLSILGMNINGDGVGDEFGENPTERIKNVKKTLESIASEQEFYEADTEEALAKFESEVVKKIQQDTVYQAQISDPLGDQYFYEPNTLSVKQVGTNQPNTLPEVTMTDSEVKTTTGFNLGEGQEIQIHYQVRLNTEDKAFKPDYWYPMNGRTTLMANSNNPDTVVDFGVPSGRAPGTKIKLEKIWDDKGFKENRPSKVTFEVGRKTVSQDTNWTSGTVELTGDMTAASWSKETDELQLEDGTTVKLPLYNNEGKNFTYSVTKESETPGYTPSIDGNTVTNTYKPFSIKVQKIWKDLENKWQLRQKITLQLQEKWGNHDWQDVAGKSVDFKPYDADLTHVFNDLSYTKDGQTLSYRIVEKVDGKETPVPGYATPVYAPESIQAGQDQTLTVTNTLKTTDISFTKVGPDGKTPLKGAKFELIDKKTKKTVATSESDATGKVLFSEVPIGEYILKETKTPTGYQPIDDLTIKVSEGEGEALVVSGLPDNQLVIDPYLPFHLALMKLDEQGNGLAGAEFTLSGDSLEKSETVTSEQATGKVSFLSDLQPGTYTLTETKAPTGYEISAEGPWTVTIGTDRSVVVKNQKQQVVDGITTEFNEKTNAYEITGLTVTNFLKDFKLVVEKINDLGIAVKGATFSLKDSQGKEIDYQEEDPTATFTFDHLQAGSYVLTETKAPDGYQIATDPVEISIDSKGNVTIDGKEQESALQPRSDENLITYQFTNYRKGELPKTGGTGTWMFTLAAAVVCGGVLLIKGRDLYRQRKGGH